MREAIRRAVDATVIIHRNRTSGHGSGFFVGADLIATCWHVVAGAKRVFVDFNDERPTCLATLKGGAKSADFALLRCRYRPQPEPLPIELDVSVPDEVYAIGSPLSANLFRNTSTRGTISAIRDRPPPGSIQFDAPVHPGNSGGPLVSGAGKVVGMVSWVAWDHQTMTRAVGISSAVPGRVVQELTASIAERSGFFCALCGNASSSRSHCHLCGADRTGSYLLDVTGDLQCTTCGAKGEAEADHCPRCGSDFADDEEDA